MKRIILAMMALFLVISIPIMSSADAATSKTAAASPKAPAKQLKVHFIDVGQGDAILVQTPNGKNMLIDGGKESAGKKVTAFLKAKGVKTLDVVIATHPDADHIGGLNEVLRTFPVKQFIDSGKVHTTETYFDLLTLIDQKRIPFKVASTNSVITLDPAVTAKVLYANPKADDTNDASVVTKVTYGAVSFLFTGDAGLKTETALLKNPELKSTYLKAGHHGSNTSSSAAFVKAVHPAGAVLSYGKDNTYGHPHASAVTLLKNAGAKIYSTAVSGDITVTTDGKTHTVSAKPWVAPAVKPAPVPVKPKPAPAKPAPVKPKPVPAKPAPAKPKPTPSASSGLYVKPGAPKSFKNCTEMRKVYPHGVKKGHPAYAPKHDRDKDGWACER